MNELKEIHRRKAAIADATNELESYIKERWPIGAPISWVKGGGLQYGGVVAISRDRVRVCNAVSGANYWIDIYWVEEALKMEAERRAAA